MDIPLLDHFFGLKINPLIIVRNLGALDYFRTAKLPMVGDFSLNVANPLSVDLFISEGLQCLTPSYDLDITQLLELLRSAPPSWFEGVGSS